MAKNKKKMVRTKLAFIKYNALKLRANYQLPLKLTARINNLTGEEDLYYIKYLMDWSEALLRVKGYYKRHPIESKMSDEQVEKGLKDWASK